MTSQPACPRNPGDRDHIAGFAAGAWHLRDILAGTLSLSAGIDLLTGKVQTAEQLDMQALHRVRERLVSQRTGIINQIRAFMLERGIAVRQGIGSARTANFRFGSFVPTAEEHHSHCDVSQRGIY
jgi:hypothetical protein